MAYSVTKLKTLYLMKILCEKSDEDHVLSAADLAKELLVYGIKADRKTIYSDIDTLEEFGVDIVKKKGTNAGYYVGSQQFELAELKLLVDAVQCSKFITGKKTEELIKKIESLTNKYDARQLHREVYIYNRPKAGNETIYYNVDKIHIAILNNHRIKFRYTRWNEKKELVERKDGKEYEVSPWSLTWDNENYYLIAYDDDSKSIRHYRVDKMKNMSVERLARLGGKAFKNFDLAAFSKKTFSMYGGEDAQVSLVCRNEMAGVIIDRFGQDVMMIPMDAKHFKVNVLISVSPQFFGWVTGIGHDMQISGPEHVKQQYKQYLKEMLDNY